MAQGPAFSAGVATRCGQSAKYDSIMCAAVRVFCRDGFAGASLDSIACAAGVSRQTVYNHHGDKEALFIAVVRDMSSRCNAAFFATLATFPKAPRNLEADLVQFGMRLLRTCQCSADFTAMLQILRLEGQRYPAMVAAWRDEGPGAGWAALAACFAQLAHAGYLSIDDAELAAKQFMALLNAELALLNLIGSTPTDAELLDVTPRAVRTFLRAYGAPARSAVATKRVAKSKPRRASA